VFSNSIIFNKHTVNLENYSIALSHLSEERERLRYILKTALERPPGMFVLFVWRAFLRKMYYCNTPVATNIYTIHLQCN
jgi:hypothetical protein